MTPDRTDRWQGIADRIAAKASPSRPSRQVRLHVVRLGIWSTVKTAFLVGVCIGLSSMLAIFIAWTAFSRSGGVRALATSFSSGSTASTVASFTAVINGGTVMGAATALALLQIVSTVVAGVVVVLAYNTGVRMTGGVVVGFENNTQ